MQRHRITKVKMLWDKNAKSWQLYGVPGQPAALLVKDGEIVGTWAGAIDEEEVLELISA